MLKCDRKMAEASTDDDRDTRVAELEGLLESAIAEKDATIAEQGATIAKLIATNTEQGRAIEELLRQLKSPAPAVSSEGMTVPEMRDQDFGSKQGCIRVTEC